MGRGLLLEVNAAAQAMHDDLGEWEGGVLYQALTRAHHLLAEHHGGLHAGAGRIVLLQHYKGL